MRSGFSVSLLAMMFFACARCSADGVITPRPKQPPRNESHRVGPRPTALAVADFDKDRVLDIAVVSAGDATLSILLGSANGFREAVKYPAGPEPSHVVTGDLDRDGDIDVVVANHETSAFTLLMNDGAGRFPASGVKSIATGARPHLHSVTAADFDGDGWLDVGVESADTREVFLCRGSRNGLAPAQAIPVGTMPYLKLAAGDVTGDGVADVLVPGHGDQTVRIVSRNASSFVANRLPFATAAKPWGVTAASMDGDQKLDLVVLETDAVSVWLRGADTWAATTAMRVPVPGATSVAVGKLDEDDIDDIVVGPWEGDEVVIIGSKAGTPRRVRVCGRPIGLAVADVDRDTVGDLVAACATEDRVVVVRSPLR